MQVELRATVKRERNSAGHFGALRGVLLARGEGSMRIAFPRQNIPEGGFNPLEFCTSGKSFFEARRA